MSMKGLLNQLRSSHVALYYSYVLMGFAVIAPWRCLVAALDYFEETYPGRDPTKWITVAFWTPSSFALLIVFWVPIYKWQKTVFVLGYGTSTTVLAAMPLLDVVFNTEEEEGRNSVLFASLVLVMIVGSTNAILDACVLGSSMNLPSQFPQAYATGLSLAAFLVSVLRLVTKGVFSGAQDGLRFGAYAFFFLCSFSCLLAILIYIFVVSPHSLVQQCNQDTQKDEVDPVPDDEALIQLIPSVPPDGSFRTTFRLVKTPAMMVGITLMVNVFVNPGIIVDTECKLLGNWYKLILLVVMSGSDILGRTLLAKYTTKSPKTLGIASFGRLMIMVISVLLLEFLPRPILFGALVCLTGLSHGYCLLSCYNQAQDATRGSHQSLTGGSIMLMAESIGNFLGSLLTIGRTKI